MNIYTLKFKLAIICVLQVCYDYGLHNRSQFRAKRQERSETSSHHDAEKCQQQTLNAI